eukprot:Nk52_evm1s2562 gene=Nk52_evmTU1s2562
MHNSNSNNNNRYTSMRRGTSCFRGICMVGFLGVILLVRMGVQRAEAKPYPAPDDVPAVQIPMMQRLPMMQPPMMQGQDPAMGFPAPFTNNGLPVPPPYSNQQLAHFNPNPDPNGNAYTMGPFPPSPVSQMNSNNNYMAQPAGGFATPPPFPIDNGPGTTVSPFDEALMGVNNFYNPPPLQQPFPSPAAPLGAGVQVMMGPQIQPMQIPVNGALNPLQSPSMTPILHVSTPSSVHSTAQSVTSTAGTGHNIMNGNNLLLSGLVKQAVDDPINRILRSVTSEDLAKISNMLDAIRKSSDVGTDPSSTGAHETKKEEEGTAK